MSERFSRAVVFLRVPIVIGWLAIAVIAGVKLPTLGGAQTGALGQVIPIGSEAVEAEQLAAELFLLPLASRTVVVERDGDGVSAQRVILSTLKLRDANTQKLDIRHPPAGAYGVTNAIPGLAFSREFGTTIVTSLLFQPEVSLFRQVRSAREYIDDLNVPDDNYAGVTGVAPARREQGRLISDRLHVIEAATAALVALTVAIYLRSLVAPLVTLFTVGVAYIISIRTVATAGMELGVSAPPEVEPIIIALLFGVVTDYGLFYMSRFRRKLAEGTDALDAARRTTAELTPVIIACGCAVAAGAGALAFADLGFLRSFGPGMAIAVLVALAVTVTLMPALLALTGSRLFTPNGRSKADTPGRGMMERLTALVVDWPKATLVVGLAILAVPISQLGDLKVGNPVIRGLPADSPPRVAYDQIAKGFAPGVVAPTSLLLIGDGIAGREDAIARVQKALAREPGVAGVLGPDSGAFGNVNGAFSSLDGDAIRYVIVLKEDPQGAGAVADLRALQARTRTLLEEGGITGVRALYAGDTAILDDTISTANRDLLRVTPIVMLAVGIVLVIFLRALIAPLYLVFLAMLAPMAAVGLAVWFFQEYLGQSEITYFVPLAAGVLLVSLGSDYNIFLVGRIWREARSLPLREAIIRAGTGASHAISAAGLVLAASFGVLALVPVTVFQQLAFVLATGLLIDAFIVRSILTPALVSLVGEKSSWPGSMVRFTRAGGRIPFR